MMKKTKLIRGGIMALFVLAALLLVYLVVRQTMPDIIPLLRSGDEEALEAYLSRDMSFTGILYMALLQMVQVWSIVISGVIVNVAAGVVYGVWRAFAICLVSSSLAHGISFTLYQRLGKYLDKLLPDNSSDKLDIVAKSEHPAYMVVTLCFLPLIPNGFIPIAASRSRLKPWEFTLAMFFGSAFSTLDFPTPDGPAKTVVFPSRHCFTLSIPIFSPAVRIELLIHFARFLSLFQQLYLCY